MIVDGTPPARALLHLRAGIGTAFERVRAAMSMQRVLHRNGSRTKAYALENDEELFAETSGAWFGTSDSWPFAGGGTRLGTGAREALEEAWGG